MLIGCHSDRTASYVCVRFQFAMCDGSCRVQHVLEYRLAHEQQDQAFWKRPVWLVSLDAVLGYFLATVDRIGPSMRRLSSLLTAASSTE